MVLKATSVSEVNTTTYGWLYMFQTQHGCSLKWENYKIKIGKTTARLQDRLKQYKNNCTFSNISAFQCDVVNERERLLKAFFRYKLCWQPVDGQEYFDQPIDVVFKYLQIFAQMSKDEILQTAQLYAENQDIQKFYNKILDLLSNKISKEITSNVSPITSKDVDDFLFKDTKRIKVQRNSSCITDQVITQLFDKVFLHMSTIKNDKLNDKEFCKLLVSNFDLYDYIECVDLSRGICRWIDFNNEVRDEKCYSLAFKFIQHCKTNAKLKEFTDTVLTNQTQLSFSKAFKPPTDRFDRASDDAACEFAIALTKSIKHCTKMCLNHCSSLEKSLYDNIDLYIKEYVKATPNVFGQLLKRFLKLANCVIDSATKTLKHCDIKLSTNDFLFIVRRVFSITRYDLPTLCLYFLKTEWANNAFLNCVNVYNNSVLLQKYLTSDLDFSEIQKFEAEVLSEIFK